MRLHFEATVDRAKRQQPQLNVSRRSWTWSVRCRSCSTFRAPSPHRPSLLCRPSPPASARCVVSLCAGRRCTAPLCASRGGRAAQEGAASRTICSSCHGARACEWAHWSIGYLDCGQRRCEQVAEYESGPFALGARATPCGDGCLAARASSSHMRRVFAVSSLAIQTTRTRTLVVSRRHKLKLVVYSFGSNMSNPVIGVLPRQPSPNVYGTNTPTEVSSEPLMTRD